MRKTGAFTLIELLIVVAIIAVLAAIAVPNFLEAQVRSKVSRAQSDMRSIATALEAYRVDNNGYPLAIVDRPMAPAFLPANLQHTVYARLTTPVAYINSFPDDAFEGEFRSNWMTDPLRIQKKYDYRRTRVGQTAGGRTTIFESATGYNIGLNEEFPSWLLYSPGPDKEQNINTKRVQGGTVVSAGFGDPLAMWPVYDPTNGTVSDGDIIRSRDFGGDIVRP